jgi:hypothetical protein
MTDNLLTSIMIPILSIIIPGIMVGIGIIVANRYQRVTVASNIRLADAQAASASADAVAIYAGEIVTLNTRINELKSCVETLEIKFSRVEAELIISDAWAKRLVGQVMSRGDIPVPRITTTS